MMIDNLARYATRVAVRRVVVVLVLALLAWCGIGKASALTRVQAHAACDSYRIQKDASAPYAAPHRCDDVQPATETSGWVYLKNNAGNSVSGGAWNWNESGCPVDETWDTATKSCQPPPPTEQECLARNSEPGFIGVGDTVREFSTKCIAGCTFAAVGPRVTAGDGTTVGTFEWTGVCSIPPGDPITEPDTPDEAVADETPDQVCKEVAPGLSQCIQKDGEVCYTAAGTNHLCWDTGETGEKTDQHVMQKRNAGDTAIPPATLNLPSGDQLQQTPQTTTQTQTKYDANGNPTTITTTVTNYTTIGGTNAGPTNDGEPADGSEGDSEEGSGGGGGTCAQKPWFTHDPAMEMVINQTWATRCAVEWGNAVTVTGDIEDCSQPYTVTGGNGAAPEGSNPGTHADAEKLRALRKQICPDDPGELDPATYLGDAGTNAGFVVDGEAQGEDGLDFAGFGWPQTCPIIPDVTINGTTIHFDTTVFCDWLKLGGQFVLICAALVSLRVLAGPGGQ